MKLRACVFEDDSLIRSLLWTILDNRGYEVFAFPDPAQCPLHLLTECQCPLEDSCTDIIISDLNMLRVRGMDFVEAQLEKGCKCRNVALISGAWSSSDLARAESSGCKVFTKPLELDQIDQWLDEIEKKTDSRRTLIEGSRLK